MSNEERIEEIKQIIYSHIGYLEHSINNLSVKFLIDKIALLERKLELCKEQRRRAYFEDLLTFTKLEKNLDEELEEQK